MQGQEMLAAYTDRPRDLTHLESVEGRADASILLLCYLYHVASRTSVSLGKRNRRRQTISIGLVRRLPWTTGQNLRLGLSYLSGGLET